MKALICFWMCLIVTALDPPAMEDFKWKNRLIVAFDSLEPNDWSNDEVKERLDDRKLLIFEFEDEKLKNSNFDEAVELESFLALKSTQPAGIDWVLVGLDGGVKARGNKADFDLDKITKLIDGMPMRKSEIRRGKDN